MFNMHTDNRTDWNVCYSVILSVIFHLLFGHNNRTCIHEVRDAESMYSSDAIGEAFDVGSDGHMKHTTEKRLRPCVLFINSW